MGDGITPLTKSGVSMGVGRAREGGKVGLDFESQVVWQKSSGCWFKPWNITWLGCWKSKELFFSGVPVSLSESSMTNDADWLQKRKKIQGVG